MSAAFRTVELTCSSCDDYQLVPGADGILVRCPDCLRKPATRCPVHGRVLRDGKCSECIYQATVAQEIIELGDRGRLHPLTAVIG